ncbi:terminase small subunit [Rufibacter quisquiliarum]|uniref:Phage terminase small subunit n=1 Tax=Rufibacter quisquiliarum TaxID=1549639 RepID=A0A839GI57_9BACT|nr:terminase small subunit [Rufibacter quisquiliarum]MBA9078310.1 phage terminase small subunit [Rufibacter quisquiliarum]
MAAVKLTDKQQRFCEEYLVDLNATQAAIRAGYSEKTAYSMGWENLRKPEIRAAIDARLEEIALGAKETVKLISDIAKASLNDYFEIKEVVRRPKVEKHLSQVIEDLKQEIAIHDEYADALGYSDKELDDHYAQQGARRREIVKLQIQLKHNPNATVVVDGPAQLVKVADLDLVKLVLDKQAGRIKSVKPSEFGTTVEMYPADAALTNLARMHGLFEKDNEQGKAMPIIQAEVRIIPSDAKIASSEKDVLL